ncbi:hypothetical protein ACVWZ6_003281 [Bradyrhizobium sp. GM6.1]
MALRSQIVNFVRLYLGNDPDEAGGVRQIAVMEAERRIRLVGVKVKMVNAVRVEERGPALDAMDFIALPKE